MKTTFLAKGQMNQIFEVRAAPATNAEAKLLSVKLSQ